MSGENEIARRVDEGTATRRSVTLYAKDELTVTASLRPSGDLEIFGQDLDAGRYYGVADEEYEYAITVARSDVPTVLAAFGRTPDTDVLDVLLRHGEEIVRFGERRWLSGLGVDLGFWARRG